MRRSIEAMTDETPDPGAAAMHEKTHGAKAQANADATTDATPVSSRRVVAGDAAQARVVRRCDTTARIFASMGLEIVSDQAFHGLGVISEDAKGQVGHCELPACEMRPMGWMSPTSPTSPASSVAAQAGTPRSGDVCLWFIERGHLTLEQSNGIHARFGAGSLLLCDLTQALRGRWERSRVAYVHVADRKTAHLPARAPERKRAVEAIERIALAPFLCAQLDLFAIHGATLAPADLQAVLGGIFSTTDVLLDAMALPVPEGGTAPGSDRLQAVHRFIQRNLHRADLSVEDIAHGANVSRAQLYRLFALQDKSVHATLREQRLVKSLGYLQQPESTRLSIGAIAHACGFSDQAVFSKLFRQRFGMTPREARPRSGEQEPLA